MAGLFLQPLIRFLLFFLIKYLPIKDLKLGFGLKSAHIQYLKPGNTNLYFKINITDADILEAEQDLKTVGKFIKTYPIEIYNKQGTLCAVVQNEVYVRNLQSGEHHTIAY